MFARERISTTAASQHAMTTAGNRLLRMPRFLAQPAREPTDGCLRMLGLGHDQCQHCSPAARIAQT